LVTSNGNDIRRRRQRFAPKNMQMSFGGTKIGCFAAVCERRVVLGGLTAVGAEARRCAPQNISA
jgi:hypothetical protein